MKWILLLFIAGVLTSCWNTRPHYVIGVSQCSDDAWRQKMNSEMQTEALLYDNMSVEICSAGDDNNRQINDIRAFIDRKVDLLIVAPNEAIPITPVVEEAYACGIEVIIVDRKILSDKYTAYIGADNYQIGKAVGEYVANHLHGRGKVVEFTGLCGSTPAIDRHQGFAGVLRKYPDITLLCSEDARWQQHTAEQRMDSLCWLYPQIDLVFAHNDRMAYGAYLAARQIARTGVDFIGIDALPGPQNGLGMVRDGILDATFIYPTGGDRVIATAMNILQGRPFAREVLLNTAIVDSMNARVLEMQTVQIQEQQQKIDLFKSKVNSYLMRYSIQLTISWFSIICLLLIITALLLVWRSFRAKSRINLELIERNNKITRQKEQLELQRDQLIELSRQLEEATQAKLMFFTNVSHDFRTPLTLISDPIEQLLLAENHTSEQRFYLDLVKKNTQILLRMVNQILDFRKYENGKLELHCTSLNLLDCLCVWNVSFLSLARSRHVRFDFECDSEGCFCISADQDKIERVYYNILSNAFEFTPQEGFIRVVLSRGESCGVSCLRLAITNSGSYIDTEQTSRIFDRFYQTDCHHTGSGIGLALCKAFVEMHHGTVQVESSREVGTTFIVYLPTDSEPVVAESNWDAPTEMIATVEQAAEVFDESRYDQTLPSVLVIDDNTDIRAYLRHILCKEFAVLEACDGKDGIHKAESLVPDLIISDVMMPKMDGIVCCNLLKNKLSTCHIPILLLTACSLDEQRIEGLNNGADAYLSKPFNAGVLAATVHNLLENRAKLRQYYTDHQLVSKDITNNMDRDFIMRIDTLIEEQIDNSAFSVEEIGRRIGMSRVQLYRKLKALTNLSPNEYVRATRLRKASLLLGTSDFTVAEIAYRTGFSSPSYFTKCFREQYQETPVDYQKRIRE